MTTDQLKNIYYACVFLLPVAPAALSHNRTGLNKIEIIEGTNAKSSMSALVCSRLTEPFGEGALLGKAARPPSSE